MSVEDKAAVLLENPNTDELILFSKIVVLMVCFELIKKILEKFFENIINSSFVKSKKRNEVFVELRINFFCKLISEIHSTQQRLTLDNTDYSNQLVRLMSEGALFLDDEEFALTKKLHDLIIQNKIVMRPNFIEETDQIKNELARRAKL